MIQRLVFEDSFSNFLEADVSFRSSEAIESEETLLYFVIYIQSSEIHRVIFKN